MAFWIEVDWARAAEDREVRVGVAQGSGCYLRVWVLAATSSWRYSQAMFLTDARGGLETMSVNGPSYCRVSAGQNLYLRASGVSGTSAQEKGCAYPRLSLDSIGLTPLVSIGFESNPFPVIIHP